MARRTLVDNLEQADFTFKVTMNRSVAWEIGWKLIQSVFMSILFKWEKIGLWVPATITSKYPGEAKYLAKALNSPWKKND